MKTAILFPGQGAQYAGMGKDLYETLPECAALFDRAGEVLGFDLKKICFDGPEEELLKSHNTQPAIFTVSIAAYTALKLKSPETAFSFAGGHSLGEWAALHAAGVVSFDDALRILRARGEFIQQACDENPGGMLAVIGLEEDAVAEIAAESGAVAANINSPGQIVMSGTKEAIETAAALCKERGAKRALPLSVAGAFHSPLMQPAADKMRAFLAGIELKDPEFPVLSNVTGGLHESGKIADRMIEQITGPVQWVRCMETLKAQGAGKLIECGPGKVLTGLAKRCDRSFELANVGGADDLEQFA